MDIWQKAQGAFNTWYRSYSEMSTLQSRVLNMCTANVKKSSRHGRENNNVFLKIHRQNGHEKISSDVDSHPCHLYSQKYDRSKCNCDIRKKQLFHIMHTRLMPKLNSSLLTSRELYQIIFWLNVLLIFIRVYLLRKATLHYICHELSKQPS